MKISTSLTPAEIASLPQRDLGGVTAVVFDILRATSTMTMALEQGATAIYPAANIDEALAFKEKRPAALLAGERHGEKIEGFDLGNSPLEMDRVGGREMICITTNGTVALRAADRARRVIAASFLNLRAVAPAVLHQPDPELFLVCAGTGTEFALEDGLAAGALIEALCALSTSPIELDDAGKMLAALWKASSDHLEAALAGSKNGRRLIERGRGAEVACCSQIDVCTTVGVLSEGALRPFRPAARLA